MAFAPIQSQQEDDTQLKRLISNRAQFKQRSHNTHHQTHRAQLESHPSGRSSSMSTELVPQRIDVVFLGDSMFERFKTTRKHTQIGQVQYPHLFNGGVGGDKIENVLYRIDLGLLDLLKPHNPKLVVLHIGTNNLRPKQGLKQQQLDDYYLLLQALLSILPTSTQILVLGLFKRADVQELHISQSNMALEELVTKINLEKTIHRVHWVDLSNRLECEHLDDHVHFNVNGYQIWDSILYPKIQELLSTSDSKYSS